MFRSSRPDYIETWVSIIDMFVQNKLFRSSRPDYIETIVPVHFCDFDPLIVPVFQAGLH